MWNEGEPQQIAFAKMIEGFEAAYPDVTVNVTWAGREVLTKLRSALLAGQQVDLIDHAADEINAALIKNDQVMPLDDLLETTAYGEETLFKDIFLPGVLDPYKANGQVVFIPYELITSAFWYDENLFAANGVTAPKTWDELLAVCETLKGKDIPCFAQDGTVDFYNAYWFYWLAVRQFGPGAWMQAVSDPTGAAWDDPNWLKIAQMEQDLVKKGYFMPGFEGSVWPAGQVAWSQGQAGALLCGSWIPNETSPTAKADFKYRGFTFPELPGGKGKATELESYLIGWVVPKVAKNPEAAKAFMKFAMTEQNLQMIVTDGQNAVTRKGMPMPDVLPDMPGWFASATTLFKPYDGVQAEHPSWWTTTFMPLHNKLLFDQITPEDFIAQVKASTIEYWSNPTPTPEAVR
jgi:raffinose/stachyose/melibiose transport system substrate-binding protein